MTPTILLTAATRNDKTRVVFSCADEFGIYGPFVEHRPAGEAVQDFVDAYAASLADSLAAAELQANIDEILNA